MSLKLSDETIASLKAHAAEAAQRSDTAAMAARSVGIGDLLGQQRTDYASKSPEFQRGMREYLQGMNSPLAGMISNSVTGDGSQAAGLMGALSSLLGGKQTFAIGPGAQTVSMTGKAEPGEAPVPASEEAVAAAEAKLGFALPAGLRQVYVEVANGGVGPDDGIYSLDELVAKWREMAGEPIGEGGEEWPRNLLPIHGDRWDISCIDRDSGRIVYFDAEEIEYGGWSKAFKDEAESLEAWLQGWLAKHR
jgi:hypothetical protein